MSEELLEVLEVFKKNSQDLESLKDTISKDNIKNEELRIKVEDILKYNKNKEESESFKEDLQSLKEQLSNISQDILDIKIENKENSKLINKVEQLSNDLVCLKEQIEESNILNLDNKVNILSNDLSQVSNELQMNDERLNEIFQKSMYVENYIETIKENDVKLNDILNKSYYIEQYLEGIQEKEITIILEDEKIDVSAS